MTKNSYCVAVSAVARISDVRTLPAHEQEKLLLAVLRLEGMSHHPKRKSTRIKWPEVEARDSRIFGERALPNLVLLECQEEVAF